MWKRNVIYCYKVINKIVSTKTIVIRTNVITRTKVQVRMSNLYIRKIEIVALQKAPEGAAVVEEVQNLVRNKIMVSNRTQFALINLFCMPSAKETKRIQEFSNR